MKLPATEELIYTFQNLWNDLGHGSQQIATQFGATRSQVAGIIKRARANGHFFKERGQDQHQNPPAINGTKIDGVVAIIEEPKPDGEITIVELRSHHCKAVVGTSEDYHHLPLYCGKRRVGKSPYCREHMIQFCHEH